MAGSSQVRSVIELFCKILEENNVCYIRADVLRQAKFNKESAISSLWSLLYNIVSVCNSDSSCRRYQSAITQALNEKDIVFVKSELQKLGYLSQSFARLPHDFSSGSRELLLAVGWVVHTQKLFDKIIAVRSNPLQQELIKYLYPEGLPTDSQPPPLSLSKDKQLLLKDKIQQQLMMCGKLRLSLRRLYMVHQELTAHRMKICKSTDGVSLQLDLNHLSPLEVYLMRYPDSLKKMMAQIEEDNLRMKNLIEWKDKENMFWEWMDSVLNLHIKEKDDVVFDNGLTVEDVYLSLPEKMGKEIIIARASLRDFILQHEDNVEKIEQLILKKKASHVEIEAMKHSLDTEILQLSRRLQDCGQGWDWSTDNQDSSSPLGGFTALHISAETTIPVQHKTRPKYLPVSAQEAKAARQATVLETAKKEISRMERRVHQLELELKQLEKENMQKIQAVLEQDPTIICIQPRYCKQFNVNRV